VGNRAVTRGKVPDYETYFIHDENSRSNLFIFILTVDSTSVHAASNEIREEIAKSTAYDIHG